MFTKQSGHESKKWTDALCNMRLMHWGLCDSLNMLLV
jgi:hypothetical protein